MPWQGDSRSLIAFDGTAGRYTASVRCARRRRLTKVRQRAGGARTQIHPGVRLTDHISRLGGTRRGVPGPKRARLGRAGAAQLESNEACMQCYRLRSRVHKPAHDVGAICGPGARRAGMAAPAGFARRQGGVMWWAKVGRARIGVEGFETDLSQMRWRMRGARGGCAPISRPAVHSNVSRVRASNGGKAKASVRRARVRRVRRVRQARQVRQVRQDCLAARMGADLGWWCCCAALTAAAQRVYRAANQGGYPVRAVSRLGSLCTV